MRSFSPLTWPLKGLDNSGPAPEPVDGVEPGWESLEDFENAAGLVPVGGTLPWAANGSAFTLTRSSDHVTNGLHSVLLTDTESGAIKVGTVYGTAAVDLSAYTTLRLDVYVVDVDTGGQVEFGVTDGDSFSDVDATTLSTPGAYTLELDLTGAPDRTDLSIYIGGANVVGGFVFHIDNLRGELE